jgi:hypothetical protein
VALTSTGPVVPYWIKSLVRPHRLAQDVALGLRAVDPVVKLIFYTASKIVLYYQRVAVARDERGTTDAEIWDQ